MLFFFSSKCFWKWNLLEGHRGENNEKQQTLSKEANTLSLPFICPNNSLKSFSNPIKPWKLFSNPIKPWNLFPTQKILEIKIFFKSDNKNNALSKLWHYLNCWVFNCSNDNTTLHWIWIDQIWKAKLLGKWNMFEE